MFRFEIDKRRGRATVTDVQTNRVEAENVCAEIALFVKAWSAPLRDETVERWIRPLLPAMTETIPEDDYRAAASAELRRSMVCAWEVRVRAPSFLRLVPSLHEHAVLLEEADDELLDWHQLAIALRAVDNAEAAAFETMVAAGADYAPSSGSARQASAVAQAETGADAACKVAKRRSDVAHHVAKQSRRAALWAGTWHSRHLADMAAEAELAKTVERGQASAAELVMRLCAVGR